MDTVPSHPILRGVGSPGALWAKQLLAALVSSVDCFVRGTCRTAWAVTRAAAAHIRMGGQ